MAGPVEVTIRNSRGLHARAAAKFVKLAETFDAELTVEKDGQSVTGTSIMGLMMLGACQGSSIIVASSGLEADKALDAIVDLVEQGFHED